MSRHRAVLPRHRRSPWVTAVLLAAALALVAAACTHEEATGPPDTSTAEVATTVDDPLGYAAYLDPAAPIEVQVGERFALVLDAEPTEGYRWEVVSEVDRAFVLPLGSQFVLRDAVTNLPTTTVAPPPPPAEGTTDLAGEQEGEGAIDTEGAETTAPPTTEPEPTTTTVPSRSLQVLSYVARAPGTTTVELRYVRVGQPDAEARTVVFTIQVPEPPPIFPVPEEEGGEEEPATDAG